MMSIISKLVGADPMSYIQMGAAAVVAGVLVFGAMTTYVHFWVIPAIQHETRELVQSEARQRAIELIQQRQRDNAEISTFDLQHFCTEFGGRWVSGDCVD